MAEAAFWRRSESGSSPDLLGWDAPLPVRGAAGDKAIELVVPRRAGSKEGCSCKAAGPEPESDQENHESLSPLKQHREFFTADPRILNRRLLDDYRFDGKVLGTGISGTVRSAVCRKTKRKVAVKSFHRLSMSKQRWLDAQAEARVYATLDHPHVAQLLSVYNESEAMHFVMECLEGGELFSRVQTCKRYSESAAADVAKQVLRAVAYLHAQGVAHCDLKLENLIYSGQDFEHLKLVDYGHAQRLAPDEALSRHCGTLQYTAPEVFAESYTEKADLWSVGVLVYMLLMGCHLYTGSDAAIRSKVVAGKPDYAKSFAQLSDGAQSFVHALLEVDPAKRLSAKEALQHSWLRSQASCSKPPDASAMGRLAAFSTRPHCQRASLLALARPLPNEGQAPLRQCFHSLDSDDDGVITLHELRQALGLDLAATAGPIFRSLDLNGDGKISWSEYVAAVMEEPTRAGGALSRGAVRFSLLAPVAQWGRTVKRAAQAMVGPKVAEIIMVDPSFGV